ncbi:gliding motility-associated protein GldL [Barnesiella viscericola DSM 18177]|uniref:Gliding motility-associated protein GldL n=1 Tax=Barnesiella viscericola DSM 18177 TaxID=880074 RepID=W0ESM8_9BACT|nr:gliding motility protein GldL [Barnesiella viscericola]AHF12558.1 gliding motility-associated protein GldL [Barnesiella viscericola DSM 18177]
MGKYKRYKNRIEKFLSSDKGQRFFNFAYSIGAAVVIWGALFKILHLPGGSLLLSIGMGTEVLMFILSAFDTPPKTYHWEEVFPVLNSKNPEDRPDFSGGGGTVIIGGNGKGGNGGNGGGNYPDVSASEAKRAVGIPEGLNLSEADTQSLTDSIQKMSAAADQLSRMAELTDATQQYLTQLSGIAEQMDRLRQTTESLTNVSNTLLQSYRNITENSEGISDTSQGYVTGMETLNRNINGLNTIYEIQLKSISSQIDNIDRVNTGLRNIRDMYERSASDSTRYCQEAEKMTQYIQQLNSVYEKMITAMTINMYRPMGGAPAPDLAEKPKEDPKQK